MAFIRKPLIEHQDCKADRQGHTIIHKVFPFALRKRRTMINSVNAVSAARIWPLKSGQRRLKRASWGILLLLASAGCGGGSIPSESASATSGSDQMISISTWEIEIDTSGGFSGRGTGGVTLRSDGQGQAATETRTCQGKLTRDELAAFERLIKKARPGKWRSSYESGSSPHGRADQFRYTLRLTTGKDSGAKKYETFWYDTSAGGVPSDLRALGEAVWRARERLIANCGA